MRVIGIPAEFNPFHKGHEYLIEQAKAEVADPRAVVMAVMSGPFTQRGLPAMAPKHVRAKQALLCGVDVVLELPFTFACAPSERFAYGSIATLLATGVITDLAFGVDCENPEILDILAAKDFESDSYYTQTLKDCLKQGLSYPASRHRAITAVMGDLPGLDKALKSPNSILALDYLRALEELDPKGRIKVHKIKRVGTYTGSEGFQSASYIRSLLNENCTQSQIAEACRTAMPEKSLAAMLAAGKFNLSTEKYLRNVLTLTTLTEDTAYMGDGLCAYIKNVADDLRPGDSIEEKLATKHFTMPRILRALASAAVGQNADVLEERNPKYLRVLGFTREGRYCLKITGKCTRLPLIHNLSDFLENPETMLFAKLDMRASEIHANLIGDDPETEWKIPPVSCK